MRICRSRCCLNFPGWVMTLITFAWSRSLAGTIWKSGRPHRTDSNHAGPGFFGHSPVRSGHRPRAGAGSAACSGKNCFGASNSGSVRHRAGRNVGTEFCASDGCEGARPFTEGIAYARSSLASFELRRLHAFGFSISHSQTTIERQPSLRSALMSPLVGGVSVQLCEPPLAAVRRRRAIPAAAMPMPKATVNEDGGFEFGQKNVHGNGVGNSRPCFGAPPRPALSPDAMGEREAPTVRGLCGAPSFSFLRFGLVSASPRLRSECGIGIRTGAPAGDSPVWLREHSAQANGKSSRARNGRRRSSFCFGHQAPGLLLKTQPQESLLATRLRQRLRLARAFSPCLFPDELADHRFQFVEALAERPHFRVL